VNVFIRFGQDESFVGVLAAEKGKILFQYAPEFLSRKLDISPIRLPFAGHVQSGSPNLFFGLPGVFYDSLPDGWGLLLMDRHFAKAGIPGDSVGPLDRLAFIGDRGMGALVYRPEPKARSRGRKEIDLASLARDAIRIFEGDPGEVLPQLLYLGVSPGGARPKVLIAFDERTNRMISGVDEIPSGYRRFLVKFPAKSDPPFPGETEYAYSLMGKEAGLTLPKKLSEKNSTARSDN
jgi:serine/threonine-protein kinase HipA